MFDKQCTDTDRQIMWALSRRFGSGCWLLWRLFLDIIWSITSCRLRADKNTYVGPGIHNFWHGGSHFSLIAEKFNVSRVILTPAWSLPVQAASPPIQLVLVHIHIVIHTTLNVFCYRHCIVMLGFNVQVIAIGWRLQTIWFSFGERVFYLCLFALSSVVRLLSDYRLIRN